MADISRAVTSEALALVDTGVLYVGRQILRNVTGEALALTDPMVYPGSPLLALPTWGANTLTPPDVWAARLGPYAVREGTMPSTLTATDIARARL